MIIEFPEKSSVNIDEIIRNYKNNLINTEDVNDILRSGKISKDDFLKVFFECLYDENSKWANSEPGLLNSIKRCIEYKKTQNPH